MSGKIYACFAVGLATAFLLCAVSASAFVHDPLRFEQYSFQDVTTLESTPPTDIGGCVVDFEPDPEEGFLNVAAFIPGLSGGPVWIVRNLRLHEIGGGVPFETITCTFTMAELGVEAGMTVNDIQYSYEVMPTPLLIADSVTWLATQGVAQIAQVNQVTNDVGKDTETATEEITTANPDQWYAATDAAGIDTVYSNIGCEMPNIDLGSTGDPNDINACMPASCANSLAWLKIKHGDVIKFPHDKRSVMDQLEKLAGRVGPNGVWPKDIAKAKLDFIEAHKLPIHVKIQDLNHEGDITSSSGHTKCEDKDGAAGQWPTRDFIMHEAKKGEDVEVVVTWYYWDTSTGKWAPTNYAHALVLTGARVTAGVYKVKVKDDRYQGAPGGTRERTSDVTDLGWGIELPALRFTIPSGQPGAGRTARPFVSAVVSESKDENVVHPGNSGTFSKYCQYIKRTVPKGGSITFTFPDSGVTRSFSTTVTLREPMGDSTQDIGLGQWNLNRGKTRTYVNSHNMPVVIMLHNDDKAGNRTPYPGYPVGIAITDSAGTALKAVPDPFNPQDYGGFSLGGADSSSSEFSQADLGTAVTVGPTLENLDLSLVPSRIAEYSPGTRDLQLMADSAAWNVYWENLGFVIDVLNVVSPGILQVDCPANGFQAPINITGPGRYELVLGMIPMTPDFELHLQAQSGLDMIIDAIGVPSLVTVDVSPVPSPAADGIFLSAAEPNPFNPRTRLYFRLPDSAAVDLAVFDVRGRRITTLVRGNFPAGDHVAYWDGCTADGSPAASGMYMCRLVADGQMRTTRMTLLK